MDTKSFFFYDLETSGLNSREDRIMQFAGIRTDLDLNPTDEQVNLLVKLSDDTLPSPGAIAVTKITPQMTQQDGLLEAELCRYLTDEIFTPGTCVLGFNSIRFDDEFMRHLFWRNFYDPYEWQWKDGRSRWDMLDVVRLTRALRPEGINWPVVNGKKTNRLELITKLNNISHEHAHDALSDVSATIAVARLIKEKQPDLFNYLFKMRDKKAVQKLINLENPKPFVYACGQYSSEFDKTSVAFPVAPSKNGNVYIWDLRYELTEVTYPKIKELKYNHCPAVAPLAVLDKDNGWEKIGLDKETVEKNFKILLENRAKIDAYLGQDEKEFKEAVDPESALYDGFLDDKDRNLCGVVRTSDKNQLADLHPEFIDERLEPLLLHYKAKNFPDTLSEDEQKTWEEYRINRLNRQAGPFMAQLEELKSRKDVDPFIIEELLLWSQSLAAADY